MSEHERIGWKKETEPHTSTGSVMVLRKCAIASMFECRVCSCIIKQSMLDQIFSMIVMLKYLLIPIVCHIISALSSARPRDPHTSSSSAHCTPAPVISILFAAFSRYLRVSFLPPKTSSVKVCLVNHQIISVRVCAPLRHPFVVGTTLCS